MDDISTVFYWDHHYDSIVLLNLIICFALFTSLRLFSGTLSHVNASDELLKKDNPAFGISMAGVAFAITIILTGAIYGEPVNALMDSVISVGVYGILGIVLMALTRIIFDRISLPSISISNEIVKGNIAAGIVDVGNVIATAIIIRAVMVWVDANTLEGIAAVLLSYVISQVLLVGVGYIGNILFKKRTKTTVEEQIKQGNHALALRFVGCRIGIAFAITAASNVMIYELFDISRLAIVWAGLSVCIIILWALISWCADKVILFSVDTDKEVLTEKNIAIGVLQGVVYLSLGLLLSELTV